MSIKIESMEMPETCDDCPFHVYHSHYEYVCKATPLFYPMNLANSKGIRKDWCPLSEASELCEDTISRQAAIEALYDVFFDDDLKAAYPDKADVVLDVIRKLPSAQTDEKRTEERTETHACDCISRSAAITAIQKEYADTEGGTDKCAVWKNVGLTNALHIMQDLPSTQPEITGEQAIEHLQSTGWMQNHDREMYDMGLKKQLADDSGSYDSLFPSAQPDIIRCKDCKHRPFDSEDTQGFGVEFPDEKCPCQCDDGWYNWRPNDEWFCANAERRTDETD